MPLIKAPLWTLVVKYKQMCTPIFHLVSLYTWELNFGQTEWDKIEVLLGMFYRTIWGLGEPQKNMMRSHWVNIGNKIPLAT
jgi:hypothetical protein